MYATHEKTGTSRPDFPTADEIRFHMDRARRMRSEAMSEALREKGRRAWRTVGPALQAGRRRLDRWATQRGLSALSDRSLADIGIPREAIPCVVRGIDWRSVELEETWWEDRWQGLLDRYESWRERRRHRARTIRELMAYSDHDLAELKIQRSDIPRLAHQIA
jgi:uncharacterized protein YjiS (DUF1127 family)